MTTITLEDAIALANDAHYFQKDKQGKPYILHCLRVMLGGQSEVTQIVGVLHDVLEDAHDKYTEDDLMAAGCDETILQALDALTKREGEPYMDYIVRVSRNPIAVEVKIVDLADNLSRIGGLSEKDQERLFARYKEAQDYLMGFYYANT